MNQDLDQKKRRIPFRLPLKVPDHATDGIIVLLLKSTNKKPPLI